jgi:hypothetical protein
MDRLGLPVSSFQELARTKAHCLLYQLIRTDFRMLLLAWLGLAWLGLVSFRCNLNLDPYREAKGRSCGFLYVETCDM